MRLRRLEVANFRGVRSLDWRHIAETAALVGPGDSGRSTILDAIERVLSPKWNVAFDDTDFWDLCTDAAIVIRATITDLAPSFYRDSKFGLLLHAFDEEKGEAIRASGTDDEVHALVVELRVDASLEPVWSVLDADGATHPFMARDREALGMLRVGSYVDQSAEGRAPREESRGRAPERARPAPRCVVALLAVAMQREAAAQSGLTIVDEFEHGLEPHRIRRLLRVLRGRAPEGDGLARAQLILTTHSPTVLNELEAGEVAVTRRAADGTVTVRNLPAAVEYILKRTPQALLARKVIVAEGVTEVGLCQALDEAWTVETGGSFGYRGVVVIDGLGGIHPRFSTVDFAKFVHAVRRSEFTLRAWMNELGNDALIQADYLAERRRTRGERTGD